MAENSPISPQEQGPQSIRQVLYPPGTRPNALISLEDYQLLQIGVWLKDNMPMSQVTKNVLEWRVIHVSEGTVLNCLRRFKKMLADVDITQLTQGGLVKKENVSPGDSLNALDENAFMIEKLREDFLFWRSNAAERHELEHLARITKSLQDAIRADPSIRRDLAELGVIEGKKKAPDGPGGLQVGTMNVQLNITEQDKALEATRKFSNALEEIAVHKRPERPGE